MSRSRLSDRKVRSKIRPLIPREYTVAGAMVRGGNPHGTFLVCLIDSQGKRRSGFLDTRDNGVVIEIDDCGWSFSDETTLQKSIAYINA